MIGRMMRGGWRGRWMRMRRTEERRGEKKKDQKRILGWNINKDMEVPTRIE